MTKNQFLEKLRTALNGKMSPDSVTENLRYYEDYINTEIRKGRAEAEVLSALGDPRLIARTIVETRGGSGSWTEEHTDGGTYADALRSVFQTACVGLAFNCACGRNSYFECHIFGYSCGPSGSAAHFAGSSPGKTVQGLDKLTDRLTIEEKP